MANNCVPALMLGQVFNTVIQNTSEVTYIVQLPTIACDMNSNATPSILKTQGIYFILLVK
jgi:hypothetical protein